jgi:hypothetical protein
MGLLRVLRSDAGATSSCSSFDRNSFSDKRFRVIAKDRATANPTCSMRRKQYIYLEGMGVAFHLSFNAFMEDAPRLRSASSLFTLCSALWGIHCTFVLKVPTGRLTTAKNVRRPPYDCTS